MRRSRYSQSRSLSIEMIVLISPHFEQEIAKIPEEVECADPAIHNPGAVSIEKIVPISPQLVAAPSGNCR
jgi:hypothetical protein